MSDKHEFALYVSQLTSLVINNRLILHDKKLVQRIGNVLRLKLHETCILFDTYNQMHVILDFLDKKQAQFIVVSSSPVKRLEPSITIILPLLKRDALEAALSSCVELGADIIQLVITKKVHRSWGGQKELDRLQRIIIAAAEQSKNFALVHLYTPISLEDAISAVEGARIWFDPEGGSLAQVLETLELKKPVSFTLIVGPEGGLTGEEAALLEKQQFIFCRLTPTILRARQAVALGLGIIRSFF